MRTAILLLTLSACGSSGSHDSGGGTASTATIMATATATAVTTATATSTVTLKVTDVVVALSQVQFCKKVNEQPPAVQALFADANSATTTAPRANGASGTDTVYENKQQIEAPSTSPTPYNDGTTTIWWWVRFSDSGAVSLGYQAGTQPIVNNGQTCP